MRTQAWWFRQSLRVSLWSLCALFSAILALKIWGERRFERQAEITQARISQAAAGRTRDSAEDERASTWLHAGQCATVFFANQKSQMNGLLLDGSWAPEQRRLAEELLTQNTAALGLMHRGLDSLHGEPLPRLSLSEEWKDGDSEYHALLLLALEGRAAVERGDAEAFLMSSQALRTFTEAVTSRDSWAATLSVYGSRRLLKNIEIAQRTLPLGTEGVDRLAGLVPSRDRERDWGDLCRWNWNLLVNRNAESPIWSEWERADGFLGSFGAWLWADFKGADLAALYADGVSRFSEPLGQRWSRWPDVARFSDVPPYTALFQSDLSHRRLAKVALRLRAEGLESGHYPESLAKIPEASEPDPLTGGGLSYELLPDGSARISVANADQALGKFGRKMRPTPWELPAPIPTSKRT